MTKTLYGFYVSFSGESNKPISNLYALNTKGETVSAQVLGPGPTACLRRPDPRPHSPC